MAIILKGTPVAEAISKEVKEEAKALQALGISPTMAIIRLGDKEEDIAYQRSALKRCEKCGVTARTIQMPELTSEEELISVIHELNQDQGIHGVLLLMPLPPHINQNIIRNALIPQKDVDGITDLSLSGVFTGNARGFAPCTASACIEILNYYNIDIEGKRAVVIGRSLTVGKPLSSLLLNLNATVTTCHTRTKDLSAECRRADLLMVCAGKAEFVDASFLSPSQVVIDVGIHVSEDGKLSGDVKASEALNIVKAITPVPGGVGSVTTSILAKHVVESAKRSHTS